MPRQSRQGRGTEVGAAGRRVAGVQVRVPDGRGRPRPGSGLERWLAAAAPASARGTVTVALVGDTAMRRLNARFRDADYATDVLSFPADEPGQLGDIAIATGVAARQARREVHSERTEWRVLALHGLLHLLGYDHERDAGQMARVERRLRLKAGLPAGLIARAGRSTAR
jgi:probable rRNA maturation factor